MADQTATLTAANEVLPQLSITTTAKEYLFIVPTRGPALRSIEVTCTADWEWSHDDLGPFAPVKANPNGYAFDLERGNHSLFMRTVAGVGTITPVVTK